MPKPKRIIRTVRDSKEITNILKELSIKYGGAWVYFVLPFSHTVHFLKFQSPSKVPDSYIETTHNRIAYKGKIVPFSEAAQIREQNRGYTGDR